ncbi:MAG: class I SAM-dependent methyltransferase [Cardiobacteriaceae bacterium]|nr:class I SAM-dependent methyltransferase [Cardiobacteriaceae bacterium]
MAAKITTDMSVLSETLLIPLWAKAVEYGREDAVLRDAEAKRMMDAIDYDFGKFRKAKLSQAGCCVRARVFDRMTQDFIAEHPDAVVMQLGAGLDARYERLGYPAVAAWYDLDLPEVIAVRRELLPESGNHYLAASLFDTAWMDDVAATGKPVLLLLEGVVMYFPREKMEAWLAEVGRRVPGVNVIMDILAPVAVGKAQQHDALKQMGKDAPQFEWTVMDSSELESWAPGWRLHEEVYLSDAAGKRFPWWCRLLCRTRWGYRKFNQRVAWLAGR